MCTPCSLVRDWLINTGEHPSQLSHGDASQTTLFRHASHFRLPPRNLTVEGMQMPTSSMSLHQMQNGLQPQDRRWTVAGLGRLRFICFFVGFSVAITYPYLVQEELVFTSGPAPKIWIPTRRP